MPDVVMYADTWRSPELRHEVPLLVSDPFVYVERNGTRTIYVGSLEIPLLQAIDGLEVFPFEELGVDEMIAAGLGRRERDPEYVLRACRKLGVTKATVPWGFPLYIADHLRANGVELETDAGLFDRRRRAKNASELAGIKRAIAATELAYARAKELLAAGPQTCEGLKSAINLVFAEQGMAVPDPPLVSHGAQTTIGHEPGHGPIAPGEPVVLDLFPQDPESGCFSDMTRTFCVGEAPEELVGYHAVCEESLRLVVDAIRPGVTGAELHRISCEPFHEAGIKTQLSKEPGEVLEEGYFHGLGHGVGLELHEEPGLGRNGPELVAGDVIAIEPGAYRLGFGGCRIEDVVLVTEDGCEVLTSFPHDLVV
jgi:Xaa-Pro aminopeptidase